MKFEPNYEITIKVSIELMREFLEMSTSYEKAKEYRTLPDEEIIKLYTKRFIMANAEVVNIKKIN